MTSVLVILECWKVDVVDVDCEVISAKIILDLQMGSCFSVSPLGFPVSGFPFRLLL